MFEEGMSSDGRRPVGSQPLRLRPLHQQSDQLAGVVRQVSRERELALQDLLYRFRSVVAGEGRLRI